MNVSRRWFIGGMASFGAFGGCRMFECHDFRAGGKPNLTFGVVSDIHIGRMTGDPEKDIAVNTATLKHTFECFRDAGADGVVIAGDMADNGILGQLEFVAATWRAVFPNDRAPDATDAFSPTTGAAATAIRGSMGTTLAVRSRRGEARRRGDRSDAPRQEAVLGDRRARRNQARRTYPAK